MSDELKVTATKSMDFSYSHRLPRYNGKCQNLHGHNGTIEVEVKEGWVPTGKWLGGTYETMAIDFGTLKAILKEQIVDLLDHNHLNDIPGLEIPTAESMTKWCVKRLLPIFKGNLIRVRIYETKDSYSEWRKDG